MGWDGMGWEEHAAGIRGQKAFIGKSEGKTGPPRVRSRRMWPEDIETHLKNMYNIAAKGFLRHC
jgi:hypothetical protein